MRRAKLTLIYIALGLLIACGAYLGNLIRLNYLGYCLEAGRYLTDEEKIRMAVTDVLKRYPPAVYPALVGTEKLRIGRPPVSPIHYLDVDDFLRLNPTCCSVSFMYRGSESIELRFLWRVAGAPSSFVNINYLVRYLNENNDPQSEKAKTIVPISNCGKPVHWWDPLHSDLFFIIQYLENLEML